MPRPVDFTLYLITDRHQVAPGHNLLSAVEAALKGGVKAVQLREKDLALDELRPLARDLRELTNHYRAKLLINHHVDLAGEIDADGVHLGGQSQPTGHVRQIMGPDKLIGVSTHSRDEILLAARQGADFVTFGPVFATPSKINYGSPQGLHALTEACQMSPLPVFALGGIKPEHSDDILAAGASGIALISAIMASSDPEIAAKAFKA